MAGCSNCGSDRLDLTTLDPVNKVFCHDCGVYQAELSPDDLAKPEPAPDRATLSQAKADIENAFEGWKCCGGVRHELNVAEAHARVDAFLAQCEANDALLLRAVRALNLITEAKNNSEAFRARNAAREVMADWGQAGWPPL